MLIALFVIAGTVSADPPAAKNFVAHLSGDEENPPVDTTATGQTTFHLRNNGDELKCMLIVANIEDVTQAHIHLGPIGENGPVVAFLFGFVEGGVTTNGVLAQGTITADDLVGPLAGEPFRP